MNSQPDQIRSEVSRDYAKRVTEGGGCGCGTAPQKGPLARLAGYSPEQVSALPTEVVANSFACGNPLAFAGVKAGDVVLDLGSGAGLDLLLAARKVGPGGRVIGVDMTDEMIAKANENIRAAGLTNVEVRQGLIEELPVESGSVDWLISNCVINLSPEKHKVFKEIARVLKPGGTMLISDIVAKDLPAELLNIPSLYSSCIAGAISEEDYLDGLRQAGLIDVKVLDRLVYDAELIESYAPAALGDAFECTLQFTARLQYFARQMAGKIWSTKVYAKKPV